MANERRLIDANEIEELFYKQVEYGATDLMDAFDDALQDSQSVNAVEVVRCGECEYLEMDGNAPFTYLICMGHEFVFRVEPNDFCSRGKRKEQSDD